MIWIVSKLAETTVKIKPGDIHYDGVTSASNDTLATILNTVYMVAGMVAVLVIVIAGITFALSQGDANRIAQARMAILSAVIGLVVIIGAFAITQFVLGRL